MPTANSDSDDNGQSAFWPKIQTIKQHKFVLKYI